MKIQKLAVTLLFLLLVACKSTPLNSNQLDELAGCTKTPKNPDSLHKFGDCYSEEITNNSFKITLVVNKLRDMAAMEGQVRSLGKYCVGKNGDVIDTGIEIQSNSLENESLKIEVMQVACFDRDDLSFLDKYKASN